MSVNEMTFNLSSNEIFCLRNDVNAMSILKTKFFLIGYRSFGRKTRDFVEQQNKQTSKFNIYLGCVSEAQW